MNPDYKSAFLEIGGNSGVLQNWSWYLQISSLMWASLWWLWWCFLFCCCWVFWFLFFKWINRTCNQSFLLCVEYFFKVEVLILKVWLFFSWLLFLSCSPLSCSKTKYRTTSMKIKIWWLFFMHTLKTDYFFCTWLLTRACCALYLKVKYLCETLGKHQAVLVLFKCFLFFFSPK